MLTVDIFFRTILLPFTPFWHGTYESFKVRSQEKNTTLFGNFSQTSDPSPQPPPLLGTPYPKKKLVFILHFRPLGTFLIFTKKLKFCQYFYIYFWE